MKSNWSRVIGSGLLKMKFHWQIELQQAEGNGLAVLDSDGSPRANPWIAWESWILRILSLCLPWFHCLSSLSILYPFSGIRSLGPHGGVHWCYKGFCYPWARDNFCLNRGFASRKGEWVSWYHIRCLLEAGEDQPYEQDTKGKMVRVSNKNAFPSLIFAFSNFTVDYLLLNNLVNFFSRSNV